MPKINSKYPELRLTIIEDQSEALISHIKTGEIDIGILALPFDLNGLESIGIWNEDFYWVTHKDDIKAGKNEITAAELEESQLMLLEDGHCLKDHALEVCNLPRNAHHSVTAANLATLIQLVAGKMGTTLIPQIALQQLMAANPLISKVHLNEPGPHREIAMILRPTYYGINSANLLCDLIREELKTYFN